MFNVIDFFRKGGLFMIPILVCSVVAVGFFIYKLMTLKREKIMPPNLVRDAKEIMTAQRYDEIGPLCARYPSPLAKILLVIVKNIGRDIKKIKESVEEVGKLEAIEMGRFIEALSTIAGLSTLLGLLGTVSGLIKIFSTIGIEQVVNPSSLATGISEALNNTAFGLIVAIPSVVFYRYLDSKYTLLSAELENAASNFVDLAPHKE
jgi:biopolymer transport protein ExbB